MCKWPALSGAASTACLGPAAARHVVHNVSVRPAALPPADGQRVFAIIVIRSPTLVKMGPAQPAQPGGERGGGGARPALCRPGAGGALLTCLYANICYYLQLGVCGHTKQSLACSARDSLITSMLAPLAQHCNLWLCLRDLQLTADVGSARAPWMHTCCKTCRR